MDQKSLIDLLKWFSGMLSIQEKQIQSHVNLRKELNISFTDFVNSIEIGGSDISELDPKFSRSIGILFQALSQLQVITKECVLPLADDEEYSELDNELLILSMPDNNAKKYLSKLKEIIIFINNYLGDK